MTKPGMIDLLGEVGTNNGCIVRRTIEYRTRKVSNEILLLR